MKKIILFLTCILSLQGISQQDPVYSQYNFNQMVINPAYAGSRNSLSAVILRRTNWVGMKNSPATASLSAHSLIGKSNIAWGVNLFSDKLGPTSNVILGLTGAYHLKMKKGKLSIGLRGGLFNSTIDGTKLDFSDKTDQLNVGSKQSDFVPMIDLGFYYYTRNLYIGLAFNHIGNSRFKYSNFNGATFYLRTFNTLSAGYAFQINENLILKPSLMLKQTEGVDVNLDVSLNALLYERVWLGMSIRNKTALVFLLEVNLTDFARVGYSYDTFLNGLNNATNGAHELFIGFDFKNKKVETISPRYL